MNEMFLKIYWKWISPRQSILFPHLQSGDNVFQWQEQTGLLTSIKNSISTWGGASLGLWACYLSFKKWSNSIHNAAKAHPLFSALKSCCAWRCVCSSKIIKLYFPFSRVVSSLATNRISQYNYDYLREGEKEELMWGKQGCSQQTSGLSVLTSIVLLLMPSQAQIWLIIKLWPNTNVAQWNEIICMERQSEFNRLSVIDSFSW